MAITQSPISNVANNIVRLGTRSENALPKAQRSFQDFSRFLDIEIIKLKKQELPDKRKIKNLANINIVSNFGSVGNLLQNLLGGALDLGGFIRGMFPGKGEKVGKSPNASKPQPKPTVSGGKLRLGGIRALGIVNAVFAGLDFATGLAEGESVGKSASGAVGSFGGSIAGSLLGGAIGQALIPIPGVGFVLGSMVGSAAGGFLGGYGADRAYEAVTGETKQKQEQQLKTQEEKQKSSTKKTGVETQSFSEVLMKFSEAVIKFEDFSMNIGSFMGPNIENPYNEPAEYPDFPEVSPNETYDGPVDGDTFFPLPGGDVGTRGIISPGQAFGAPRDGGTRSHAGLDMTHHKGSLDAPVVAYKSGKVIWADSRGSYNSGLMIDHGNGIKTKYFHITPLVKTGDIVYGGQQIARLFPAGQSTHLHFEVHKRGTPINPLNAGVGPGGSAKRLPAPLSIDKAKQNSLNKTDNRKQTTGINLYPQQPQTNPTTQNQTTKQQTQSRQTPVIQPLPQNVMVAPSPTKPEKKIETYPSYSQSQSYIIEKPTLISSLSPGQDKQPTLIPVGSGGGSSVVITPEAGSVVLNSLMKNILLTNLSAT